MLMFQTPLHYSRRLTRTVSVGSVDIGGSAPIGIQSMLTSNTCDIPQVLEEIKKLADVKCPLIRLTVPNKRAVESLPIIRDEMKKRGLDIPLSADIHFNPQLAIDSCEFVEKVRINPGNYADRKEFKIQTYTDAQYEAELERIEEKLLPLITNLKKYGRALRIGTNHGSLSDRILNRYGDTPEGMVESALEFIRIFEKHDYHDIIISMKSSIPLVMLQAYKLLFIKMEEEGMNYPLHLGVTEAGNGLDGRIKSAIGIGSLLYDGIGDTIRVSLTEPAENEIPAAQSILDSLTVFQQQSPSWQEFVYQAPISFSKRATESVLINSVQVGGTEIFRFFAFHPEAINLAASSPFDEILIGPKPEGLLPSKIPDSSNFELSAPFPQLPIVLIKDEHIGQEHFEQAFKTLVNNHLPQLILIHGLHPLFPVRRLVQIMDSHHVNWPIGIVVPKIESLQEWSGLAAEIGGLVADGLINGLVCPTTNTHSPIFEFCQILLQSTRARIFKADFISCPSCGRTFFDLEATTEAIKARTQHLKGIKIGIMGCIVNGPGEMADADFGYVGVGVGKINLYKGQECVEHNIPAEQAVDRLIDLIKQHGQWVEPS